MRNDVKCSRRKNYQRRKMKNLTMDHMGFWESHSYILKLLEENNISSFRKNVINVRRDNREFKSIPD